MTPELYGAAWGEVANLAARPVPRAFGLSRGIPDTMPAAANAVYVACNRSGSVIYVGSSIRTVRRRVDEHVTHRGKGRRWDTLWVIPLREDLRESLVRIAEGRIGRVLHPTENGRLPRC